MHLQETAPVRNKIKKLLSRMGELESIFGAPTLDEGEKSRRSELLRYVIAPRPLKFRAEFLPVSSRASKDNYDRYMRKTGSGDSLTTFKAMRMYSASSKVWN